MNVLAKEIVESDNDLLFSSVIVVSGAAFSPCNLVFILMHL